MAGEKVHRGELKPFGENPFFCVNVGWEIDFFDYHLSPTVFDHRLPDVTLTGDREVRSTGRKLCAPNATQRNKKGNKARTEQPKQYSCL